MAMISSFKFTPGTPFRKGVEFLEQIGCKIKDSTVGIFGSNNGFMLEVLSSDVVLAAIIFVDNEGAEFHAVAQEFYFQNGVICLQELKEKLSKLELIDNLTINVYPNPDDGQASLTTTYEMHGDRKKHTTLTWKHNVEPYADPQNIPSYIFNNNPEVLVNTKFFRNSLAEISKMTTYRKNETITVTVDHPQLGLSSKDGTRKLQTNWKTRGKGAVEKHECSFVTFSLWALVNWASEMEILDIVFGFHSEGPDYARAGEAVLFETEEPKVDAGFPGSLVQQV